MVTKKFASIFLFSLLLSKPVSAHCPLCTVGAGAAAGAAVWLGVSTVVVALFIGAFAMSMGMWFSRVIKKKYIPLQNFIVIAVIFLTTLLPLLPLFNTIGPLYIPFIGEYGKTFAINYSLVSGFFGGLIVFTSPKLNKKIKQTRNGKSFPYQGMAITFSLLLIIGLIIQLTI